MTARTSLRTKVPLYIGTGLLVVIVAWTWVSYVNVRNAMLETGEQRLTAVTEQLAESYERSLHALPTNIRNAAGRAGFHRQFGPEAAQSRDTTLALMRRLMVNNVRRVTLFALDGTPVLSVPDTQPSALAERHEELADEFVKSSRGPDFGIVAPLRIMNDTVVLPTVSAILRDSQPVGFITIWRAVVSSDTTQQSVGKLLGAQARIFLGNTRGDLWSNLGGTVRNFPGDPPRDSVFSRYDREDGTPVMATARAIQGTPISVAASFEVSEVMAPASQFLRNSIILGAGILALATLAAWWLSLKVTTPLHVLTEAAGAVAGGDLTDRRRIVVSDRRDEIGQLADSFNRMVAHVDASHHALETKVQGRTRELQDRNEELEAFAHSISHDLRAPLRAMHGFSQALLEDCAKELGPQGVDYATRIAAASARMDALTQDLLAYSRVSRTEMVLTPVDLVAIANGAVSQLEADVAARHARVSVQEPMPRVMGHKPILEQVVMNLVANGLKFVKPESEPRIAISAERSNGTVRLWVADNGIGIDPQHHQRIFSVFERLHGAEQYAGTGIGLAIVRKGVERMGGRVGVDSGIGTGSRFWVELHPAEG